MHSKISNHRQLGGVETSVLDNGSARGVRIAWINTGSGLRYKVVTDRAMDIADTFFNQHSIAWLSHSGIVPPANTTLYGTDWLKTFGGGLLATCGLAHAGAPEAEGDQQFGLHGRIGNIAAEIIDIQQPDMYSPKPQMSITGIVRENSSLGYQLELKRTISSPLGKSLIHISDEVTNRGNEPAAHLILYHCNFGWPLVDEGSLLYWDGRLISRGLPDDDKIFLSNHYLRCPPPLPAHNGAGEACAFIDIDADENGVCQCGIINSSLNLRLDMRFPKSRLPWLTNWQHWGKGEYVTALEPASNMLTGRKQLRENRDLLFINPGETLKYWIEIEISAANI